jgi:hypothetical protein
LVSTSPSWHSGYLGNSKASRDAPDTSSQSILCKIQWKLPNYRWCMTGTLQHLGHRSYVTRDTRDTASIATFAA